jgi:hypothetical protein
MSNPIKYSTGSETLVLKKGNMYIGTGDVGKGPSDVTGYYQGVDVPSGGYVIYMNKEGAPGGLSYHSAVNDSELIAFTNNLAGQSYTTVNECLVYFAGQTDKVCLNRDYEGIVTDGLVLNVDAGFTPSYPKNGTTWYDVGGSNNGTLTNGPTFSTDGSGTISFDGTNDFIDIGYKIDLLNYDITQEAWVNTDAMVNWHGIISNMPSWGTGFSLQIGPIQKIAAMISGSYLTTSWTPLVGVWYHIVATHRSSDDLNVLYVNGVQENTVTRGISYVENAVTKIGFFYTSNSLPFDGKMGVVRSYNRALTASEVLQNYNAQKGRFGL